MNFILISFVLVCSLLVTILRGAPAAFVVVYLPVLLLVSDVLAIQIEPLPDMTPLVAAIYGIAVGFFFSRTRSSFRFTLVDASVVLLTLTFVIGGVISEHVYTGVSRAAGEVLSRLAPYFLARLAFASPISRRNALRLLLGFVVFSVLFAAIELRFFPWLYKDCLLKIGLETSARAARLTYGRFGFFRASVSFIHPISFGNGCLVLIAVIALLASTTPQGVKHRSVRLATCGLLLCIASALSFSAWVGLFGAALAYLVITYNRWIRSHLVLLMLVVIAFGVGVHYYLRDVDTTRSASMSAFQGSFKIRALIVQNSWDLVSRAGLWGWGTRLPAGDLNLKSVDDAYLVFILLRGWSFLVLWLLIPLALAYQAERVMPRLASREDRYPIAVTMAVIVGLMLAWMTVFADLTVTQLYFVLLGFAETFISARLQQVTISAARPVAMPEQARFAARQLRAS